MPAISNQPRLILWIIVGISGSLVAILSLMVGPNIINYLRKILPGEHRQGNGPASRSWATWVLFWTFSCIAIIGAAFANTAPTPKEILDNSKQMYGDYRVVVIPFSIKSEKLDIALGREVANDIYGHLNKYFQDQKADLVITIWSPEDLDVGDEVIKEGDATKRAEDVAEIANRINADLVVYGEIEMGDMGLTITPEYYVRSRDFYQAEELLGQYNLGTPVKLQSYTDISERVRFATAMQSRTQALSQIILGLSYYSIQKFVKAQVEFLKADEIRDWQPAEGKQVLYLMVANAAIRQNNLDLAENYYKKSLVIDNTYSRPLMGLGDVYYRRALLPIGKSNNPADLDLGLINISQEYVNKALTSENQPPLADIPIKAHFELGEINFMLKYGGFVNSYDPALNEFIKIVQAYGDGINPRIKERAAESDARIGLIYSLLGNIDGAIQEYQKAVDLLVEYPDRQKTFQERIKTLTK